MREHIFNQRIPQLFLSLLRPTQKFLFQCFITLWPIIKFVWGAIILGVIFLGIVQGIIENDFYALLTKGKFDPIDFYPLLQLMKSHLFFLLALLFPLIVLTFISFLVNRHFIHSVSKLSEYTLQRVHQLDPINFKLAHYIPGAYIYREADQTVRGILRNLAHSASLSDVLLGVCVFGKPAQGKTRLIWEAMQAELSDWLLVRWPGERDHPFDFASQKGQKLVLWLDDLHEYATPEGEISLNDLPRRFHEAGVRLIILATCQSGDEQLMARKYLGRFLERLQLITLPNIEEGQADDLTKLLIKEGVNVLKGEFDGTPGSLVIGIKRMQVQYQRLFSPSQQLLKAMKLLRSAYIYTYSVKRVRAVARELFGFDEQRWRNAWEALDREDFVRLVSINGERLLKPVADI